MDPVLAAARPAFDPADVVDIARRTFDVESSGARDLGSERDQAFLLLDASDRPLAVMKVSNIAEDPRTLDMEALAVLHASRVDPLLPLAIPWLAPGAASTSVDPVDRRVPISAADGDHHVRMYSVLPGRTRVDAMDLSDAALGEWGEVAARVGRALRGFFHPSAQRTMLWDVQHAARSRELLGAIRDAEHRDLVEVVLDRFETTVMPVWPALRAQVVHGDLTTDNALTDAAGMVSGIVDFGDMSHSALVTDLASLLDSLLNDRTDDELFRSARLVLDGYQRITPLEPVELRLLPELLAARAAVTIAISSWRAERGLEDATFAERYNGSVAATIRTLLDVGWDEAARRFGAASHASPSSGLAARREAVLGPAMEALTVRRADPRRERERRVDDGGRRASVPRRVQQRPVRRARPSAGRRGDRPAGSTGQHQHALPARDGDRARRAARGDDATRGRPRHRHVRELGIRGERRRVAAGDDRHRERRGALYRLRVPRRDRGHRRPVTRVVAGLAPARHMSRPGRHRTACAGRTSTASRSARRSPGSGSAGSPRPRRSSTVC